MNGMNDISSIFRGLTYKDDFGRVVKLPVAFERFLSEQRPPYLVWRRGKSDDFYSDNQNLVEVSFTHIELYMAVYEEQILKDIQANFKTRKIPYSRDKELYIDSERLFLVGWSFSII